MNETDQEDRIDQIDISNQIDRLRRQLRPLTYSKVCGYTLFPAVERLYGRFKPMAPALKSFRQEHAAVPNVPSARPPVRAQPAAPRQTPIRPAHQAA